MRGMETGLPRWHEPSKGVDERAGEAVGQAYGGRRLLYRLDYKARALALVGKT